MEVKRLTSFDLCDDLSNDHPTLTDQPSIISSLITKTDQKLILKYSKEQNDFLDNETKRLCKIMKFSCEWSFEDVIEILKNLDFEDFSHLFIFIIEVEIIGFRKTNSAKKNRKSKKIENVEKLKKILANKNRPLLLQLTSITEDMTKFYYKDEDSIKFYCIDQSQRDFEKKLDFSTFFCSFLDSKIELIYDQIESNFTNIKNSSLILRFLRILKLDEEYIALMMLRIAQSGSKKDLLAMLDASFCQEGRILSEESQKYLYYEFCYCLSEENSSNESANSVLLTAVKNRNEEVINFLITYWSHLIQQLSFEHQLCISETALETYQMDVLCDLLEFSDFPFPLITSRFCRIINERDKLCKAISEENTLMIDQFIENNSSLKFNYCPNNKPALTHAKESKKFKSFCHLKSKGFEGENCEDLFKNLCKTEKHEAHKQFAEQRKKNVKNAILNEHCSIMILSAKSSIHNRRIEKHKEIEYRKKIMKWFEDIYKIAPELLDVAASCESLKIIFDFETLTVGLCF